MPIYKTYNPNKFTSIKVWKILEDVPLLNSNIKISKSILKKINSVKSNQRKIEILCTNLLLHEFGIPEADFYYDSNGRPLLKNGKYISISHTNSFVVMIISDLKVAIDIEKKSDRIMKVVDKFLDFELLYLNDLKNEIDRITILWCLKECVYKISEGLPFIFKSLCIVLPFNVNDSSIKCWIKLKNTLKTYNVSFFNIENHKLVYIIDN